MVLRLRIAINKNSQFEVLIKFVLSIKYDIKLKD